MAPRYQTLAARAVKIAKAIELLAAAEPDWPTYDGSVGELREAIELLDHIQRHLRNHQ
jgi:hypothetical protein